MKTKKTLLVVLLVTLTLLIFSIVYAGFSIRLEKDVYHSDYFVSSTSTTVTFHIYDSQTSITPVISQTFYPGEYVLSGGCRIGEYPEYPQRACSYSYGSSPNFKCVEGICHWGFDTIKADFTNTEAITRYMDLWLEMELDGVVVGNRERVKHEAWSMFSYYDSVPSGVIVAWSGSINSIPQGWALCDGTNGTPDLRSAFIVGAANQSMVGKKGFFRHTHGAGGYYVPITYSPTSPMPTLPLAPVLGTSASTQSLPVPYYSLAYIMKL